MPPGAAALGPRVPAVTGGELGQNLGADEDLGAAFQERGCHFHMLFQAQKCGLNPIVSCSGHGKKIKERGGKKCGEFKLLGACARVLLSLTIVWFHPLDFILFIIFLESSQRGRRSLGKLNNAMCSSVRLPE